MPSTAHHPILEINLSAIARNYTTLAKAAGNARTAAVVKADAYGLGARAIAPVLYDAGCRVFFVATLEEAVTLSENLADEIEPRVFLEEAVIYVLNGVRSHETPTFLAHRLRPVINSMEQLHTWNNAGHYALHIDTGMNRLGINLHELDHLPQDTPHASLIMSHLACANNPAHAKNQQQLKRFHIAQKYFANVPASLANSSGIFLGEQFHADLVRPGCSLYGISPNTAQPNPVENVVALSAPILQYRTLLADETVGYDATVTLPKDTVLATVELGYADGFLRSLSNTAHVYAAGKRLPVVGIVSMDMISVDVTIIPEAERTSDLRVTIIGDEQPVDILAHAAGTIGYEIFTRLGSRIHRHYRA